MGENFPKRSKLGWIIGGIICVLVLSGLMFVPRQRTDQLQPIERLKTFDGALDNRKESTDLIRSQLYVEASQKLKAGDAVGAEGLYRQIVAKYPGDPGSYQSLGACLFFQKNYTAAQTQYQHALDLDPRSAGALYGLGSVAYALKRSAEAKDYLERTLALDPNDAFAHRLLGFVYDELGDKPRALQHYQRALALDASMAQDAAVQRRMKALQP